MQQDTRLPALVMIVLVLGVTGAGCSLPATEPAGGTLVVVLDPPGAEAYLDNKYRGTTPVTVRAVSAGTHHLELRMPGRERWESPVTIVQDGPVTVTAVLVRTVTTLPVTIAPPATPVERNVLVHIDAFNVGDADTREVTVGANLYHNGRMVCWNTILSRHVQERRTSRPGCYGQLYPAIAPLRSRSHHTVRERHRLAMIQPIAGQLAFPIHPIHSIATALSVQGAIWRHAGQKSP